MRFAAGAVLALSLVAASASAQTAPGGAGRPAGSVSSRAGRCGVCHPAERVEFERSRHAAEEVRCVSCHGGNDRTLDEKAAHGGSTRIARAAVPKMCASCHADEKRMRPYNLPVDQYALYQTSGHGQRLARGDTRVAVCSDCHGAHAILAPSDPASRVFRTSIARTCGGCHGDTTLMKPRGIRNTYAEYMTSVHAHALLDEGNPRAPTCVSCHGVHGAAPPQVGDVDKVCGMCHSAERRYFVAGPHREGMLREGLPECASCHQDHATQVSRPERLGKLCADCHGDDSEQSRLGSRILTEYQTANNEITQAEALIAKADAVPLQTEDYRARIAEARTYLREALPSAHSLSEETVSSFTARARSVATEIEHDIHAKLGNLKIRKLVLILFWFYVLLTILVLRRFQRRGRRT